MRLPRCFLATISALLVAAQAVAAPDPTLAPWIDGPQRSEANRARDGARQPAATLAFFGLRPDQTVVEIWPSVGLWWFEILAPYLRERGGYGHVRFVSGGMTGWVRQGFPTVSPAGKM